MRKKTEAFLLIIILLLVLAFSRNTPLAKANATIYIRANGSIDPPDERIQQKNEQYIFASDIYVHIIVEKDNIIINGNGYKLEGTGTDIGIDISARNNVTIQNIEIKNFEYGIFLGGLQSSSNNNKIIQTNIKENKNSGIYLDYSSNYNILSENNIIHNNNGVYLYSSSNNHITRNNIIDNSYEGIFLSYSSNDNIINENNIAINWYGINFERSSNNIIYGNNFLHNTYQTNSPNSINTWSNNDASIGNYWSTYNGTDNNGDGLGDTSYSINEENYDQFPSMTKFKIIPEQPAIKPQEELQPYTEKPTNSPISMPEKTQQPAQKTPANPKETIKEETGITPEKEPIETTDTEKVTPIILLLAMLAMIIGALLCTAYFKIDRRRKAG